MIIFVLFVKPCRRLWRFIYYGAALGVRCCCFLGAADDPLIGNSTDAGFRSARGDEQTSADPGVIFAESHAGQEPGGAGQQSGRGTGGTGWEGGGGDIPDFGLKPWRPDGVPLADRRRVS